MSEVKTKQADFGQLRVSALESRKADEMSQLIRNLNGKPRVVPSMREVPLEENKAALAFGQKLFKDKIDVLILFTGVGAKALIEALLLEYEWKALKEKLKQIQIVARGPKSRTTLMEYELAPTLSIDEPNTWRQILKTIDEKLTVDGKTVAVQEYGEPNKLFLSELTVRGAKVVQIPVYRALPPEDTRGLENLIDDLIHKNNDVVLFTNSTQVTNLFALARAKGQARELRNSFKYMVVGSVGPSCSETLRNYGVMVDVEPERPMMGALVVKAANESLSLLTKMKSPEIEVGGINSPELLPDYLQQSLFLKACRKEKTERTPVWLMRQAGRYMKEYRELRAKVSFLDLCKNSDLASEVTVDAAHRLGVDAAIIFSDILVILEPMGFDLSYEAGGGPNIGNPFRVKNDLKRIKEVDVLESLQYCMEAIRKTRHNLKPHIPLIGFVGAPFTLVSYMIEGKSSRNFIETKKLMYSNPHIWAELLNKTTDNLILYLNAQIEAGCQAVQIFDSWAGCLSPEDYRNFVLPYTRRLIQGITPGVPVINFATQNNGLLPIFKEGGGDVIGVDWRIELDEAWEILGDVAIMGNLDPVTLFSNTIEIKNRVKRILNQAAGRPGHIFNLGHGVLPETPIDNVLSLIESVKELSTK